MQRLNISTPIYIAGAIFGLVMVVTSLVFLFVQPSDVAQAAQNNVGQPVLLKYYTGIDGGYYWVTPTPCVVSDYVVRADACQGK